MSPVIQANVSISVSRTEEEICARAVWLDRACEMAAEIVADIHTFVISEAWCETLKAPDGMQTGLRTIKLPEKATCYIEGKKQVSALLKAPQDRRIRYLLHQCINGVIQAETYTIPERGFRSFEEYNLFWDEVEKDGCRMYSNPAPEDLRWTDYVPQYPRRRMLFTRNKNFEVRACGKEIRGRGCFMDSYHELYVDCVFDADTVIRSFEITYERAPGKACFDNRVHGEELIGRKAAGMSGRDIVDTLGRSQGCYHLVEITRDLFGLMSEQVGKV